VASNGASGVTYLALPRLEFQDRSVFWLDQRNGIQFLDQTYCDCWTLGVVRCDWWICVDGGPINSNHSGDINVLTANGGTVGASGILRQVQQRLVLQEMCLLASALALLELVAMFNDNDWNW
jgi:hypothetical protein